MDEINAEILSLIDDAVIIARGGRIELANRAAAEILGERCAGKKLSAVLGADLASVQSADYTIGIPIGGKECIVRSSKRGGYTTLVIRHAGFDAQIANEAFISSMRSSLNLLNMSAERCRAELVQTGNESVRDGLCSLTKSVYVITRQITNLSYAAKIINGDLEFAPSVLNLASDVHECIDRIRSLTDRKIEFESPSSLVCSADMRLITVLLANLVSNCVIHGGADTIKIRLTEGKESVFLAVNDNGVGIPSDKLGSVFERYRSPHMTGEMYGGTGVGLTVARGIATAHGGTLLLESREGHGTSVRVSIRKSHAGAVRMRDANNCDLYLSELLTGLSDCIAPKIIAETEL